MQANIENLRDTIDDILTYFEETYGAMSEASYLELKVVLNELIINAIRHGSKEDKDKFVKVVAGLTNDEYALLIVEDDGEGYEYNLGPPPRREQIESVEESGRGICIVKSLCEDFMINAKGNKVVVNKKLQKQP
jgi:serine/threonine-protein kinase RsbW